MMLIIKTWQARHEAGLTLQQLEEITGIGKTTLNNIENGKRMPRLDQLECIAFATGKCITDLFESTIK